MRCVEECELYVKVSPMWKGLGFREECGLCAIQWAVWKRVGYME